MCFEIEIKEPGCPVLIVWRNYASKEFEVTCLCLCFVYVLLILLDNNTVMVSYLIVFSTLFMFKKKNNKKGMKNQDSYHKILSIPVANERWRRHHH